MRKFLKIFIEFIIAYIVCFLDYFLMTLFHYKIALSFVVYLVLRLKNIPVLIYSIFFLGLMDDVFVDCMLGLHAFEYTIFYFCVSYIKFPVSVLRSICCASIVLLIFAAFV